MASSPNGSKPGPVGSVARSSSYSSCRTSSALGGALYLPHIPNSYYMYHKHLFIESENGDVLFCNGCGKTKDIHLHKWKEKSEIINDKREIKGFILICTLCGDCKNHFVE